jgi:suppressor for copper-sensitivity B
MKFLLLTIITLLISDQSFCIDSDIHKNHNTISIAIALSSAFFCGFAMNAMPCVLPILAMKLSSVSKNTDKSYLISIIFGILSFFAILGTFVALFSRVLIWGSHFQNQYVLLFLIVSLSIFLLVHLGRIDIKTPSISYKGNITSNIVSGFLGGFLITILSTPCCGPLIASISVVSSSFQNKFITFLIIFTIGFGLSVPYIIVIFFKNTKFIKYTLEIIKNKAKDIISGFIYAVILWLIYIIYQSKGMLFGLSILLFQFSILYFGKKLQSAKKIITYSIIFGFLISLLLIKNDIMESKKQNITTYEKFDPSEIDRLVLNNKIVFIHFTAEWCFSCKILNLLTMSSMKLTSFMEENDILYIRADITKPNDEYKKFMIENEIKGIPSFMIYSEKNPGGRVFYTDLIGSKDKIIEEINRDLID